MRTKRRVTCRGFALLLTFSLAAAGLLAGQETPPSKKQKAVEAGYKEFTGRVERYLKLRKEIEDKLPALKSKEELPELISAHQQALARKIGEARPHAKPGDIFTRPARDAFRHVIHKVFQDPQNAAARAAIRQIRRAKRVPLRVNGNYPDAVAETTFPATLLEKLPILPEELAYRIVGRDLVLVDIKANLVVDLYRKALP